MLPTIVYFSAFISIMYHLGAMQWLIFKIAWVMQISLNASATECMVAAGMKSEVLLFLNIRPLLNVKAELIFCAFIGA